MATGFKRINVPQAQAIIARGETLILDVRDEPSYRHGHIAGAQLVTEENFQGFVADTPKEKPLIVCCYHGNSSQAYANYFAEKGFAEVYSLDGGFEAWDEFQTRG